MFALLLAGCLMEIGVEDCDAMFRQNCSEWKTLRVSWRRTSKPTEASWKHSLSELKSTQELLERNDLPANVRAALEARVKRVRSSKVPVIADHTRTIQQDFWSDRNRFQWRYRWSSSSGHEFMGPMFAELSHPDCESLPSDLIGPLSKRLVVSGGFDDGSFRVWFGGEKIGAFWKGGITLTPPAIEVEYFPPLAMPSEAWHGKTHPIDSFFRQNPVAQCVVGDHLLGDVTTKVVVKCWNVVPPEKSGFNIERAYLDLDRGAIPLRIEYGHVTRVSNLEKFGTAPYGAGGECAPLRIVHGIELSQVRPEVHYPVRGFDDRMGPEAKQRVGKNVGPLVVYETTNWSVSKVEIDRVMSPEMFELKFPPNTAFHDAKTNEVRVTGGVDGFAELAINRAVRPVKSRSGWLWWGIPSGLCIGLVAFVAYLRRGRKAR